MARQHIVIFILILTILPIFLVHILMDVKKPGESLEIQNILGRLTKIYEHFIPWNTNDIRMDDKDLIKLIQKLLVPPATPAYNFRNKIGPGMDSSSGQMSVIKDILEGFGEDCFYIESGALDGEKFSNTLLLEKTFGWRGVLVEPNPLEFEKLLLKHRNAWAANFCLSVVKSSQTLRLYLSLNGTGTSGTIFDEKFHDAGRSVQVQCFPLYSLLLAVNRTTIDFLSLDTEGTELEILRTVPFDKVIFKVLLVEHKHIKQGLGGLRKLLIGNGYIFFGIVKHRYSQDSIFIHNSVNLTKTQKRRIGQIFKVESEIKGF